MNKNKAVSSAAKIFSEPRRCVTGLYSVILCQNNSFSSTVYRRLFCSYFPHKAYNILDDSESSTIIVWSSLSLRTRDFCIFALPCIKMQSFISAAEKHCRRICTSLLVRRLAKLAHHVADDNNVIWRCASQRTSPHGSNCDKAAWQKPVKRQLHALLVQLPYFLDIDISVWRAE